MKELLKLLHIGTKESGNFQLRDFNLTIGSGEVIYLAANTDVEKYLIKNIITGVIGDYQGSLYVGNRKQLTWDQEKALDNGICYVDERNQLAQALSVMENICAIRKTNIPEIVIDKNKARKEAGKLLELLGLQRDPEENIKGFSHFEKQLVCIAKLLYRGASLLIIDGLENKYSMREILHMRKLIEILSARDVAFLLLQRQSREILSVCTKCVLMREGSDGKILFPPEITRETINEYQSIYSRTFLREVPKAECVRNAANGKFSLCDQGGVEKRGHIVGFYDLGLNSNVHFREYLQELDENQVQITIDGERLGDIMEQKKKAIMVGRDSVEELIYTLKLGENLAFPFRSMMGSRRILLKRQFCVWLEMEFLKKFQITKKIKTLNDLSYYEKKLLSIYRWLQVGEVHCIFLEEPYLNLQGQELEGMRQYIMELSKEHAPLGIFSKSAADLVPICDIILLSYNGQFLKYCEKETFDQILSETIKMLNELE